jgi:hypothetical protein
MKHTVSHEAHCASHEAHCVPHAAQQWSVPELMHNYTWNDKIGLTFASLRHYRQMSLSCVKKRYRVRRQVYSVAHFIREKCISKIS